MQCLLGVCLGLDCGFDDFDFSRQGKLKVHLAQNGVIARKLPKAEATPVR